MNTLSYVPFSLSPLYTVYFMYCIPRGRARDREGCQPLLLLRPPSKNLSTHCKTLCKTLPNTSKPPPAHEWLLWRVFGPPKEPPSQAFRWTCSIKKRCPLVEHILKEMLHHKMVHTCFEGFPKEMPYEQISQLVCKNSERTAPPRMCSHLFASFSKDMPYQN